MRKPPLEFLSASSKEVVLFTSQTNTMSRDVKTKGLGTGVQVEGSLLGKPTKSTPRVSKLPLGKASGTKMVKGL